MSRIGVRAVVYGAVGSILASCVLDTSGLTPPSDASRSDGADAADAGELSDTSIRDGAAIDATDPNMINVPAGPFLRGCAPLDTCYSDESPNETITLSAYSIDRTEVTQAAYEACVVAGACSKPAQDYDPVAYATFPVRSITWMQAHAFCAWANKRLPTEAEWEKAARGADGGIYPWGNAAPTCGLAVYTPPDGSCGAMPDRVGSHASGASPYGALDMAGNVWEWVADWYGTPYAPDPTVDPKGPATGSGRVMRGGSWDNGKDEIRASVRGYRDPSTAYYSLGVRCAR